MAAITAWISANIGLVVIVGIALVVLMIRHKDAIKGWFSKGGDPASDSSTDQKVMKAGLLDKFNISDFLTELSKHPLIQKLDISREALVRTLFSFWLIKMADWARKTSNLSAAQKSTALSALKTLAPLIQVGGDIDTPTPDEPPTPAPAPAPVDVI